VTSIKNRINDVTWMDAATRATALDKADSIVHKIGYPDFVANPAELDDYYQKVSLRPQCQIPLISLICLIVYYRDVHVDDSWRRGSVVRTSVCSWRTFPNLRL